MRLNQRTFGGVVVLCLGALVLTGCTAARTKPPVARDSDKDFREVPEFLKGTLLERSDVSNTESFQIDGYGLIAGLRGTGDSTAPTAVRTYMIREMVRHGFGSSLHPEFSNMTPERALADPGYGIVRVAGFIPPGARRDQRMDVVVSALPDSETSSLAHGSLFTTDLRIDGANPINPGGNVNPYGRAEGPIFINPVYAVGGDDQLNALRSRRRGVILGGGRIMTDRPLILTLRKPQLSMARSIEHRINYRFQGIADMPGKVRLAQSIAAAAQDEGAIHLYVPKFYKGDWEHFLGVVTHLFMNSSPQFVATKARELVDEAMKPDAPLLDISYCWEGLGEEVLPHIRPLIGYHTSDIAFAAARAAAFLGDSSAQTALYRMARTPNNAYQIPAIQVLGAMENSPAINDMLRQLLVSDQTTVRIEAYRVLAANRAPQVYTTLIDEKFVLDIVHTNNPPVVWATRTDLPRIAIIGTMPRLDIPLTFTTMNDNLSISSREGDSGTVTIFYRGSEVPEPVRARSSTDLAELIAWLGGAGNTRGARFDFTYADVVGILQELVNEGKLSASVGGELVKPSFVLQQLEAVEDQIYTAPSIEEPASPIPAGRPQADVSHGDGELRPIGNVSAESGTIPPTN